MTKETLKRVMLSVSFSIRLKIKPLWKDKQGKISETLSIITTFTLTLHFKHVKPTMIIKKTKQ